MDYYFPEEIILEILYKLPIKSLMRCMCMCKHWHSLVRNPSFLSNHLKLSISCANKNPIFLLHYLTHRKRYTLTEHYSLYSDKEGYNLYFPFEADKFSIVGTVNGLICLVGGCQINTQTFIIWNPLIKKSVTLPKPTITCSCIYATSYGLGFDSHSNDYKVLRVIQRRLIPIIDEEPGEDTLVAEIYSLNTNSWQRICGAPRYDIIGFGHVFANGVMHMLAFRRVRNNDSQYNKLILGFDMGEEVFKTIEVPPSLSETTSNRLDMLVYKESIAVGSFAPDWLQVWVMEEYGVVESWTKILYIMGPEWPRAWGFRKNEELFLEKGKKMYLYEPKSQVFKPLEVTQRRYHVNYFDYFVESMELHNNAIAESDPPLKMM